MKNLNVEYKWTEYQTKIRNKSNQDEAPKWETPNNNETTTHFDDSILFSDDTGIGFTGINEILQKVKTYDNVTTKNGLLVNWEKVFILTKQKLRRYQK